MGLLVYTKLQIYVLDLEYELSTSDCKVMFMHAV